MGTWARSPPQIAIIYALATLFFMSAISLAFSFSYRHFLICATIIPDTTLGNLYMRLMQLIYASTPFGFDAPTLKNILSVARHNNAQDGITGALICRADLYLQILEGTRSAVTARFHKILADDRHLNVVLIWSGDVEARMFPEWYMRDDPARSWMWTQEQIAAGAIESASEEDVRAVFARLIREE